MLKPPVPMGRGPRSRGGGLNEEEGIRCRSGDVRGRDRARTSSGSVAKGDRDKLTNDPSGPLVVVTGTTAVTFGANVKVIIALGRNPDPVRVVVWGLVFLVNDAGCAVSVREEANAGNSAKANVAMPTTLMVPAGCRRRRRSMPPGTSSKS